MEFFSNPFVYVDTFYPASSGGYAIVQDTSFLFLDKKGCYKPISPIEDLLNGSSEYSAGIEDAHTFLQPDSTLLSIIFILFNLAE